MPEPRSVQIALDGAGRGTVKVNHVDISRSVRGLTLRAEVDELPRIELELLVFDVATHAEVAKVYIPEETEAALIALGWDPPVGHPDSQRTQDSSAPRLWLNDRVTGTTPDPAPGLDSG
ncbi:hypothetical protein AMK27_30785 [Streptomyces sp. CB02009]|uniref:hypothetical protein n=1 Tax=Streptomyces sp. CB02009 TaxID=1703938 RepID=UPI000938CDBF|nr:hypothetical protein [Streptomyces sp. CB02009]OKJ52227.1 hypothetical protein AMK27_30785 [Streptomyces sp. CB02009]